MPERPFLLKSRSPDPSLAWTVIMWGRFALEKQLEGDRHAEEPVA